MRFRKTLQSSLIYLIIVIGAVNMIMPFIWMISTSLKEYSYILDYPPRLIPEEPTLNNFTKAWFSSNFQQYFKNSLFITFLSVFLVVMFSAMMAYAFPRLEFPGKEAIFYSILLVLMIPNLVGIIPQFLLAKKLGLRNSLWGLILFYVSGSIPFNTFLFKGIFRDTPKRTRRCHPN